MKKKKVEGYTFVQFRYLLILYFYPEDDEDKIREELGDLIDDNPIEEDESGSDSESEDKGTKRKRDDDDDELDDRLSDDDFDLIEENLGIKVKVSYQKHSVEEIILSFCGAFYFRGKNNLPEWNVSKMMNQMKNYQKGKNEMPLLMFCLKVIIFLLIMFKYWYIFSLFIVNDWFLHFRFWWWRWQQKQTR